MYGKAPIDLALVSLTLDRPSRAQYLPIKMPYTEFRIPSRVKFITPLLEFIDTVADDQYVYLTTRCFVAKTNRQGWHSDGFNTGDINYIWSDRDPTEFCIQPFLLTNDCDKSLIEMEEQARAINVVVYPNRTLLKLDNEVIHRPNPRATDNLYRMFVKITVSDSRYNLEGNSLNELFEYNWVKHPRANKRNHPSV